MKNFIPHTISTVLLSTFGFIATAQAETIVCSYEDATGMGLQTLMFEGPQGVTLSHPSASGYGGEFQDSTIDLKINGSDEPVEFEVEEVSTRPLLTVTYKLTGDVWVNDIELVVLTDYGNHESVWGTWTTDSGTLDLACEIQ